MLLALSLLQFKLSQNHSFTQFLFNRFWTTKGDKRDWHCVPFLNVEIYVGLGNYTSSAISLGLGKKIIVLMYLKHFLFKRAANICYKYSAEVLSHMWSLLSWLCFIKVAFSKRAAILIVHGLTSHLDIFTTAQC